MQAFRRGASKRREQVGDLGARLAILQPQQAVGRGRPDGVRTARVELVDGRPDAGGVRGGGGVGTRSQECERGDDDAEGGQAGVSRSHCVSDVPRGPEMRVSG